MSELKKLLSSSSWEEEEQFMDGASLGYAEMVYVGDVDVYQARKEFEELTADHTALLAAARNDLEFLKEIQENVTKGKTDITRHEMALEMISDWIKELAAQIPRDR